MRDVGRGLLLIARPRGVVFAILGSAALGVLAGWQHYREVGFPTSSGETQSLPILFIVTMVVGVLPALAMESKLQQLEAVATIVLSGATRVVLTLTCGLCYISLLAGIAASSSPTVLLTSARALLGWTGLALCSGKAFHWRGSWALPTGYLCLIIFSGGTSMEKYLWWDFARPAPSSVIAAVVALAFLAFGSVVTALTPWRIYRIRDQLICGGVRKRRV